MWQYFKNSDFNNTEFFEGCVYSELWVITEWIHKKYLS